MLYTFREKNMTSTPRIAFQLESDLETSLAFDYLIKFLEDETVKGFVKKHFLDSLVMLTTEGFLDDKFFEDQDFTIFNPETNQEMKNFSFTLIKILKAAMSVDGYDRTGPVYEFRMELRIRFEENGIRKNVFHFARLFFYDIHIDSQPYYVFVDGFGGARFSSDKDEKTNEGAKKAVEDKLAVLNELANLTNGQSAIDVFSKFADITSFDDILAIYFADEEEIEEGLSYDEALEE